MAGVGQPNWVVTAQQQTNRTDATGRFVAGWLVTFSTKEGLAGSVFIPENLYTPEYVKQAINARYVQMQSVQNLTG